MFYKPSQKLFIHLIKETTEIQIDARSYIQLLTHTHTTHTNNTHAQKHKHIHNSQFETDPTTHQQVVHAEPSKHESPLNSENQYTLLCF